MFVRKKTTPRSKNISVQIAETLRVDGKTKQYVLRHVGTAPPGEELDKLIQLGRSVLAELKQDKLRLTKPAQVAMTSRLGTLASISDDVQLLGASLEDTKRVVLGIHDVYGRVYDQIGFSNPFSNPGKRVAAAAILREIVMARIANPDSKRASVTLLAEQFGVELNLDHVYQMMDKIDDRFCNRIQEQALASTLRLTGEKLRVLFYDATTLYFESFTEDVLKENGYSKDMKFNQPQVLLALFVTQSGLPVGYELFPGATFEGNTLMASLCKLKERYPVDGVIVVADRGMLSEHNLRFLEDNGYRYIVGAKLRSLDEAGQNTVLSWVKSLAKEKITEEVTHRVTVMPKVTLSFRIFFNPLTESDCTRLKDATYVLWREEGQWSLAFYEKGKRTGAIPVSEVAGLEAALSHVPANAKKISHDNRKSIRFCVQNYYAPPRTLVLSYRPERARKDRADREKATQKLLTRLKRSNNPKQLISNYGFQKFIQVRGEATLQIDAVKLAGEARWDGVVGMYVNDSTLTDGEVIRHYRGLWQVEESFRIQKHDLKIRPVYHWTPRRIEAHIAIAFMAFVCVRNLEYRVATQSQKLSPRVIKNTLLSYQASIIKDNSTGKIYLLPSKANSELKELYRVIGQKPDQGLKEIRCSA